MSNPKKRACCAACDKEKTNCINNDGGNPTQQEKCEKLHKHCIEGCKQQFPD